MSDYFDKVRYFPDSNEPFVSEYDAKKVIEIECNKARTEERERIIKELEEEREEILNSNDYENEIINWCLDEYDKAIEIVKGGE